MSAVALGFLTAPMLMLNGCGNYTGSTKNYTDNTDNSGQDNSVDNRVDYGSGTVLIWDANCSVIGTPEADAKQADGNFTVQEVNDGEILDYPGPKQDLLNVMQQDFFGVQSKNNALTSH